MDGFNGAAIICPKGCSCDVIMADPDGVVVRVADGVMRVSHAGEGHAGWAKYGIQEGSAHLGAPIEAEDLSPIDVK